jgi:mannan polymerase II complex MNN11 subunit
MLGLATQLLMLQCTGYATFFPDSTDYDLGGAPSSWARVPAVRHALTKFPHSTFFWYLDQNSLIMDPLMSVEGHVIKQLEFLMLKDQPIVPPDSVIKTFPHLKPQQVDLILTQDKTGLAQGSFIIRRGEWSKFFLDTWFDPLYRSYNFQKADAHALVGFPLSCGRSSADHPRNISCNGTLPSCRSLSLSPSEP